MAEQPALGFGALLRRLRTEARLTQEDLAEAAGLSPRSVSDLERGVNRTARKDTAELLASALGLAGTVRALFVAAARGRAPAADVLAALGGEAVEGLALAPAGNAWEGCPYLGLMPFQERDAKVFYGRGDLVTDLVQRLAERLGQTGMLLVAGEDTDASRAEREAFIAALHAAATVPAGPQRLPSALVIAAVRADFLGRLIAYPPLKASLDAGPFTVGPMSEAELRLAMTGPAAEADLVVQPAVVDAVISELREGAWGGLGSGVLPLMSQAMAATWESREGSELTLRAYRRAGGPADAVNRTAQAAYNSLSSQQQDAARLVFTQLTTITLDGQFERRKCTRADLRSPGIPLADINAVIDAFSAQRLLVPGEDGVEISHDILLQAWKQLRDWLGDDQLDRALYGQVVTDAQTWDINGRDSSYLYRPGRLAAIDAAVTR